jgi:DNA-directed RNA polymerase subunit RPC12/RpoP
MAQAQVFQCPNCGANLSYDGGPQLTFACQYCGTSVIVPEELRPNARGASRPSGAALPGNFEAGIQKLLADVEELGIDNVDDPDLLPGLQSQMSDLINQGIKTAGGARAAQLAELLRVSGSGQKKQAAGLFSQAFPAMSASDANLAAAILGGGPLQEKTNNNQGPKKMSGMFHRN